MLDYTLFGESHGPVVGVLLRHVPAGIPVDALQMEQALLRRRSTGGLSTARRETDQVQILSGVFQGHTTGMPLVMVLPNSDVHSQDYDALRTVARPGHADYTARVKAKGFADYRGGGHFSGRLTAPLVAAGSIARTVLASQGVTVSARIVDEEALRRRAAEAKAEGDSVGGQIVCTVTGLPAGLGGPDWPDAVESEIARHVFAIPAVKAVGFGAGEEFAALRGSQANDPLRTDGTRVWTETNHNGGINGGITNGMPVVFTVTFKPTPTIEKPQNTVDLERMMNVRLSAAGRHDSCIVLRAAPIVEAAAALAICQLWETEPEDDLAEYREKIDEIDEEIVALLAKRLQLGCRIGTLKAEKGQKIRDKNREAEVLRTRGDMAPEFRPAIEAIFETIMAQTREVEK